MQSGTFIENGKCLCQLWRWTDYIWRRDNGEVVGIDDPVTACLNLEIR